LGKKSLLAEIKKRRLCFREGLHELLDSLFKNHAVASLSFIGGTAIRVLHQSYRFSEDLDFDNFGLSFREFEALLKTACRDIEYKSFLVE
jgi:predicted nucleotidyltransferase component of viral defense system